MNGKVLGLMLVLLLIAAGCSGVGEDRQIRKVQVVTPTGSPDASAGAAACPAGFSDCHGSCVDFRTDTHNCGRCGNDCGSGRSCAGGTCIREGCPSGRSECAGACVDLDTDSRNCGSCGNACTSGEACCEGSCITTQTDEANCGRCGNACGSGYSCVAGRCIMTAEPVNPIACRLGQTLCGTTCVNLDTDENNCGECGNVCRSGYSCSNGRCASLACGEGQTLCGTRCVNLEINEENCGECGNACGSTRVCLNGECTCPTGMTECMRQSSFGMGGSGVVFCAELQHDADNCGRCGNECPSGQVCQDGVCGGCAIPCGDGETCCGGQCLETEWDEANCGECGRTCSGQEGTCCNGNCTNLRNTRHCGGCNRECPPAWICVDGNACCLGFIPWICHPPT